MLTFRNVVVAPYTDLLLVGPQRAVHRGGPAWPDFDNQRDARHQRGGEPVDAEPDAVHADEHLAGAWAWSGPISSHFGHQVIEFSMRLVPTLAADPAARFLFAVPPSGRHPSVAEAPPFFRAILEWFGISGERCRVVTAPVRVDELRVVAQAEQLGGPGPASAHLDRMDAFRRVPATHDLSDATVYVSRAGLPARFAGERSLEEGLVAAGVTVMRPEQLALADQLRIYASARQLVFAEGSALYALALMGRTPSDIVVLNRRPGGYLGQPSLRPRANSLRYHNAIRELIPGRNWRGEPVTHAGLTLLDEDALLDIFDRLDIPLRRHWNARRFAEQCADDRRDHTAAASGPAGAQR
jgi:hypothetical protein